MIHWLLDHEAWGRLESKNLRFQFSHTHAYPGCQVTIGEEDSGDGNLVEFSDGVIVPCRYEREANAIILTIAAYATSRGTRIGEKSWILLADAATGGWRVKARAPKDSFPG